MSTGTVLELGSRARRKPRPRPLAFPCPSRVVTQATRVFLHALRMSCKARDSLSSIGGVAVLGVRLSHPLARCKRRGCPRRPSAGTSPGLLWELLKDTDGNPLCLEGAGWHLGSLGPAAAPPLSSRPPLGDVGTRRAPEAGQRGGAPVRGGRLILPRPCHPPPCFPSPDLPRRDISGSWNAPRCGPWDTVSLASQEAFQVPVHTLWVSAPPQSELHRV